MRLRKKPWISQALEDYKGKELLEDGLEAYKGKWRVLLGDKPLFLEIGCGKGQFISQMAQLHPENAYLGIETQRDVCYYAVKKLRDLELDNARILRADAAHLLDWFEKGK